MFIVILALLFSEIGADSSTQSFSLIGQFAHMLLASEVAIIYYIFKLLQVASLKCLSRATVAAEQGVESKPTFRAVFTAPPTSKKKKVEGTAGIAASSESDIPSGGSPTKQSPTGGSPLKQTPTRDPKEAANKLEASKVATGSNFSAGIGAGPVNKPKKGPDTPKVVIEKPMTE